VIDGIVYDGNPEPIREWCQNQVGPGRCNYTWHGRDWHVTIVTANGHEVLRPGDAVIRVGDALLGIVRTGEQ
jgi:hypothetical protein